MAIHGVSDIVIPEVISGSVMTNAFFENLSFLRSGYVLDLTNTTSELYRDGGDSITFLTKEFGAGVTRAKQMAKTSVRNSKTGVTAEKIKIGKHVEVVIDKTVSIEFDRFAFNDVAGEADINVWLAEVIAQAETETIQDTLMTKAVADDSGSGGQTPVVTDLTGETVKTVTVDSIALAKKNTFGDKADSFASPPGLFLNSAQAHSLVTSADFKSLGTAATPSIVDAQAMNGAFAFVHGVLCYRLDSIPLESTGPDVYNAPLLAPNSLGLMIKDLIVDDQHNYPGTVVASMDTHFRYVGVRFRRQPVPVGVLRTQ